MPALDHPAATTRIALTGFMAAGKSTVGRALAALLNWQFIDLDAEIERAEGQTIREIFARRGEAGFRSVESETLRAAMAGTNHPSVIALGGGTFIQPQNAALLGHGGARVIFLDVPIMELLQRCRAMNERRGQNARPLADDEERFCALYAERLPSYRNADLTVKAEQKNPEEIAGEIAKALRLKPS
jgi:shikimate kinase